MELLVLGGTSFAGRHVVERALAEGHSVTTFNRGRTNPGLFPAARSLHGDRSDGDYDALNGAGPFDAVVDMCAYVPRAARETAAALGSDGLRGPYILISSVSVYAEPPDNADAHVEVESWRGFTEDSPLAPLPEGTDRFTYWVRRVAEGGEVLAPESPATARTQVVDAADLADWIVASATAGRTGTYNAVAPTVPLARVLDAARSGNGAGGDSEAEIVWVPWEFLEAEGVGPWSDLPAWVPVPMAGALAANGAKAAAAGLRSRPIETVVADLAAWDRSRPRAALRAGMSRERQAELLRKFREAGLPPGP